MNKPNTMESVDPGSGSYSLKADLRLNAWLMVAVAVYLASRFGAKTAADAGLAVEVGVALSPLIPGALYVRTWVLFIRGLDELQRRIQVESFLFAALATVFTGATIGVLNEHGLVFGPLQHGLGLGPTFMAMLMFWSIGWGIAKCRYR